MIAGFETANGEIYELGAGGQTRRIDKDGQKSEWAHCVYLKPEPNGSRPQTVTNIYNPSAQHAELWYASKNNNSFEPMVYENGQPIDRPKHFAVGMIKILDASEGKQVDCRLAHGMPDYGSVPFELLQDKYGFNIPRLGQAIVKLLTKPDLKLALRLELTVEEASEHQKASKDLISDLIRKKREREARESVSGTRENKNEQTAKPKTEDYYFDDFYQAPRRHTSSNANVGSTRNFDGYIPSRKVPSAFPHDASGLPIPSLNNMQFLSALVERFCPDVPAVNTLSQFELVKLIGKNKEASEYFSENHIPLNPWVMEVMNPGETYRREAKQLNDMAEWQNHSRQRSHNNQPTISQERTPEFVATSQTKRVSPLDELMQRRRQEEAERRTSLTPEQRAREDHAKQQRQTRSRRPSLER